MAEAAQPGFGERLHRVFRAHGHLCVGIDPHAYLLERWGLPDDAEGAARMGAAVVEAAAGRAGIVKPQIAFFERHGSAGYAALERVLALARAAGLIVIGDVKRGDVGSSVDAYAQAWLTPGHPLECDAITLSPFQGFGSLHGPLSLAQRTGKGVFVLAATSNPESAAVQGALVRSEPRRGMSVAAGILADVDEWNREHADGPIGSAGVVIGATIDAALLGLPEPADAPVAPVLAPGFGHQGAGVADIPAVYGRRAEAVIVNESRGILSRGPGGLESAIAERAEDLAQVLDRG